MRTGGDEPVLGSLAPDVETGLRRLGRTLRLRLALRGLGWTAVVFLAVAWISLIADYGLYRLTIQHLSLSLRLVVNGLCLAGVAVVAWKRLIRPLSRSFTEADLAALVERAHPQLQDRLLSAVHFTRGAGPRTGASPELIQKVIGEANEAAAALRFSDVLQARPVWKALLNAAGLLALTAGAAWLARDLAAPWAQRNLFLQDASYPKRTRLHVAGPNPIRVLRGDPLTLTVTAQAGLVAPAHVTFHMRFPSTGSIEEAVPPVPHDRRIYVRTLPMVSEAFSFHVTGNDDRTGEVRVDLVEPPELRDLELEVRSPPYTGLEPRKIRRGVATLDVPEDGVIGLNGLATKDIATATLLLDQEQVGTCRFTGAGTEARRRITGSVPIRTPKPYRPCLNLRVILRDEEGFENAKAASYNIVLRRDQPPVVHLEAVRMEGEITSQALIPLVVTPRDDYGVAAVHLEWGVQSAPQKTKQELLQAYPRIAPEPEPLKTPFDLRQIAGRDAADAPPLQVGETLRLQATVIDSRPPPAGGAQKAVSNLLSFRIVTTEDLVGKAVEVQRAAREQVDQVLEMQKDIRERCRKASDQARQPTTLGMASREVSACGDTEQQIQDLLGGVIGRIETLLEHLRNNRAITGEDEVRLRASVIEPLKKVTQQPVAALVRRLDAAKAIANGDALAAEVMALIGIQDQVLDALKAILNEMAKVENAQHVEGSLRAIIKLSDEIRTIMKAKKEQEDTPPKQEPGPDPPKPAPKKKTGETQP